MKNNYSINIIRTLLILMVLFIQGCDNKKTKESIPKENNIIKLKMAHNLPENSALHEASVLFSKKVRETSNNKINIEIYPKQKLGNDYQMVEMTRNGDIDILLTPTAKMSVTVPSMQYADLPFIFPSREDAYELLDGEVGKMILKDLTKIDLLGVTFWENGFKHFTANNPLLTPKDFKDKKIRIMKSRIIEEQFKALDAKPIPIDFHATKKALEDKIVDGQENPLVAIVNMGFHKVQSDLTISEHAYLPYVFSISKKSLINLPLESQNILIEAAKSITSWERQETQKREKKFLETIKKEGVTLHTLSAEQKANFRNETKHIIKMYEDVIGSHIISKTEEVLFNKYKNKDDIVFGIDVNLSKASGLAIKRGVELAIDEINSSGGLLGKKVNLIAKDHKGVSTRGIDNIEEFTSNDDVKVIIGGKFSAIVSSEMEYIQKGKKPFISPWASANKIVDNGYEDNYIFRVSANNLDAVKFLFDETFEKNKNPLVLVENSIWGRGALSLIEKFKEEKNIRKINSIVLNRGETNFNKVFEKIKNENIDSLLIVLNSKEGTTLLKNLSKENIKLPIISHWGIVGGKVFNDNKEYLEEIDLKFIQTFSFLRENSMSIKLGNMYLKKYGKKSFDEINAPAAVAQAYDSTKIFAMAIKNANSFDGVKIKNALENLEFYKGIIKDYNKPFNKTDHEALEKKDFFFAKYSNQGVITPLKD